MTPDLDRFLELATRPLEGNPGLRDEAKAELMARVSRGGVPLEMLDLSGPVGRLEATKPNNPWPRRIALLLVLIGSITVLSGLITRQGFEAYRAAQASMMSMMVRYGGLPGYTPDPDPLMASHLRKVAPGLPLGLRGGDELKDWLDAHPDDVAMLQEQVSRSLNSGSGTLPSELSPELLAEIDRLDPDNAVWPLIRMIHHLRKATGSGGSYYYGSSIPTKVTDEPEFAKALELFSAAAAKEFFRDHSMALKRRQIDAFPRSRTIADDTVVMGLAELITPAFNEYSSEFEPFLQIQVDRLEKAGDKADLAKLKGEWRRLAEMIADAGGRGECRIHDFGSQCWTIAESLSDSFGRLGMTDEKAEMTAWRDAINTSATSLSMTPEVEAAAGIRVGNSDGELADLTLEEVHPSRRTEHAFFDRILASILALVALLAAGLIGLESCRRSKIVKGMARGMMPLFRADDHLWIGGLGLALPWLWWWGITRLTPLGLRDMDFNEEWTAIPMMIQPAAALIFGLAMLLQSARWRWGPRGGFASLDAPLPWLGWLAAGLAGLAVPAAGIIRYLDIGDDEKGYYLLGVGGMAGCSLLWLLWGTVMNLFTPRDSALRPNLAMRVALPWALLGVVSLIASVMISSAMERRWFARDPLLPTWTSDTHLNALEERAARLNREALGL